jgi:hypothetical protein
MESILAGLISGAIAASITGPSVIGSRGNLSVTAISGKPSPVDHAFLLGEDCSRLGWAMTESMQMPENGHISIRDAKGYPHYRNGNPRAKCNKLLADGMMIEYTSKPGYHGPDIFSVKTYVPGGLAVISVYYVTVK